MNQAYKDFIQFSLDQTKPLPKNFDEIDWEDFYFFCYQHSILGVVYSGLERIKKGIPQHVLFEWISFVESIKQQNNVVNQRLIVVSKWFNDRGLSSVFLKGQANGLMYSRPELRSPGDIDVWVDEEETELIKIVQTCYPQSKYTFHHVEMPIFANVSVEVHYIPAYLINWRKNKKLLNYINREKDKIFRNKKSLNGSSIGCLTCDFDIVYQILHMFTHLFSTRNNFKQFIDYYYLLLNSDRRFDKNETRKLLSDFGVLKYSQGIMWIMKEVLGLDEKFLYVDSNENIGRVILGHAMNYGSFSNNRFKANVQQVFTNFRMISIFPEDVMIRPIFLLWYKLGWEMIMKRKIQMNRDK